MAAGLTTRQKKLKEKFIKERGYWDEVVWEPILRMDPDFFEAYWTFWGVPWKKGVLPPKIKELIYIAIDASTTHLYERGLKIHISKALKAGATKEEIMEVLELVSVLGIHSVSLGVPILVEESKKIAQNAKRR